MSKSVTLGLAVLASLSLAACDRSPGGAAQPVSAPSAAPDALTSSIDRSHRGSAMPGAVLKDTGGKTLNLATLKGKPLLINLWATWCGPCVREMPTLDALAGAQAGTLRVVTVSEDMGGADKVKAWFAAHKLNHVEPWLDSDSTLAFFFNAGDLPTSVLYDSQGREVWRMTGGHDWSAADTSGLISEAK